MASQGWPFGQAAASVYLRELLTRPDLPYRVQWMRHAQRSPAAGQINILAIARLLVEERQLWPGVDEPSPIKDVFYRALAGEGDRAVLSPVTLGRFVEGFGFSAAEEQKLRALLAGVTPDEALPVSGSGVQIEMGSGRGPTAAQPAGHETVSLHELHYLGPEGLPLRHTTVQVIRARVDNFRSYSYRIDTDRAHVEVSRGGYAERGDWLADNLFEFRIVLRQPLRVGETAAIQYDTTFSYDRSDPPPREFRRGATGRTNNLEMYVQFHRARLPRRVWWAEWDDVHDGASIVHQERVPLNSERAAHRYLPFIERSVVGYYWEF